MNTSLTIITQEDYANHPLLSRLLQLHDIPKQIYIAGNLPEVTIDEFGRATPRILTVVGSRKYTEYGRNVVEKLITSLSSYPVVILSGLALGIDSLSHIQAIKNNITTIAIPGSGLDKKFIYPSSHLHLAEEILQKNGALISELPPETSAAPWTFPARNRIMAALSDVLLVIEAEEKSGTLITARQALELGKDIGAVPGEIFSPTSLGTNSLIHDGAYLIGNEDDLFEILHLSKNEQQETSQDEHIYTKEEAIILQILRETTEKDTLLIKSNLPLDTFLAAFSSLEISGIIEETFGEVRKIV